MIIFIQTKTLKLYVFECLRDPANGTSAVRVVRLLVLVESNVVLARKFSHYVRIRKRLCYTLVPYSSSEPERIVLCLFCIAFCVHSVFSSISLKQQSGK